VIYSTRMNKIAYLFLLPLLGASTELPGRSSPGSAVPMPAASASRSLSIKPVRWSVVDGGAPIDVVAGRTVSIPIQADIANGWHIYSITQKAGGPIPLSITLVDPHDFALRGLIKAPKPERFFDKNFGMETELYSGRARFAVPVGVPGQSKSASRRVQLGARYQVCSATLCLPARTDKLDATLRVIARK
jgi:DsbC/DsbD-like thiol-disulfide interchange protein